MPQIDHLLRPGERIHLVTREHGVVLAGAFLRAGATVAAAGAIALELSGAHSLGLLPAAAAVLAGTVALLALLRLVRRVASWHARRLTVTDRKVVLVQGVAHRRVTALPLSAIDEIEIVSRRRLMGVRCGALMISSSGRRGCLFGLRRLPHPDRLAALLLGLADEQAERRAARTVAERPFASAHR
jgi:Bacterial PH domain